LHKIRDALNKNDFSRVQISIGDTPTCSVVEDFSDVDEIRPGNFVFYDITQLLLGSCAEDDIAVTIACPVVAKHKERNEIVIYGGAVHLSKEFIVREDGTKIYGYIASKVEKGWGPMIENSFVSSISQEHGIVKTDPQFFDKIKIGDILMVLPIHSCLAVNLLREYQTLEGESIKSLE
jgi:D-serine deaminase-like pyridoxal phosphate-dependent protein